MKNSQLEKLGVEELSYREQKEHNGGGLIVLAFALGVALAYYESRQ